MWGITISEAADLGSRTAHTCVGAYNVGAYNVGGYNFSGNRFGIQNCTYLCGGLQCGGLQFLGQPILGFRTAHTCVGADHVGAYKMEVYSKKRNKKTLCFL